MDGGKQKRRRSPKQKVSGYNNYGSKIVFSKAATEQEFPHDVSVGRMISYLIGISLNLVIFAYLTQLKASDDCMCAEARGWMPTFLQYALAFSIMLIPFTMFLRTRIDIMAFMWQNGSLKALGLFAFGIGIIKAYAMLTMPSISIDANAPMIGDDSSCCGKAPSAFFSTSHYSLSSSS